jgi:uncharacterized protein (DUF302 family)
MKAIATVATPRKSFIVERPVFTTTLMNNPTTATDIPCTIAITSGLDSTST